MRTPLTPIIKEQLPFFIRSEYSNFEKLIEDYYLWMESDDNFLAVLTKFYENNEVNYQVENYVKEILKDIGWDINRTLEIDYKTLLNTLREFYLGRGNANSFIYLFKALFGEDVEVSYPRERLFQCSASAYSQNNWIVTSANEYKPSLVTLDTLNILIEGQKSKTSVNANKIIPFYIGQTLYLKILIEQTNRNFIPEETVKITISEETFLESVFAVANISILKGGTGYRVGDEIKVWGSSIPGRIKIKSVTPGTISSIAITNGGTGYVIGDRIKSVSQQVNTGGGFSALVTKVTVAGAISSYRILSEGARYTEIPLLEVISETGIGAVLLAVSTSINGIKSFEYKDDYWRFDNPRSATTSIISSTGSGASLKLALAGCISKHEKTYKNQLGVLGTNSILLDSLYFQNFSYQLKSSVSNQHYTDLVEKLTHPVGFIQFSSFVNETNQDIPEFTDKCNIIKVIPIFFPSVNLTEYENLIEFLKIFEFNEITQIFKINTIDDIKMSANFEYTINAVKDQIPNNFSVELRTLNPTIELITI